GLAPDIDSPYDLDQQVLDLLELLKANDLPKVSLVGLSNGGRVALKFASLFPERCESIVSCDSYGNLNPLLKSKLESWLKAHRLGGSELRFDVALPWVWGESFLLKSPELVEHYRKRSKQALDSNIIGLIKGALSGSVELSKIYTRTLFLVGEEDLLTPPSLLQALSREVSGSRLKIIPGGHASIIENPESIKREILPFLKEAYELG
ncbi:MAG: 3-oxoadipate enol-lactonase, partial [Bacteriovoracaceae bacterium]